MFFFRFYLQFYVVLRCVRCSVELACIATCIESTKDDTSGTIDECTNTYFYMLIGLDRKTNESPRTHTHTQSTSQSCRCSSRNVYAGLTNENEWTHSLQSFTGMNQIKLKLMCFCVTRLDRKCVLRTSSASETTTTTANPHTFNSIFEKCSFRNRLVFPFACSTNSRTPNTGSACCEVNVRNVFLLCRPEFD